MAASTNAVENLFAANAQWAADVAKAEPNFFKHSAMGQTPHVSLDRSVSILRAHSCLDPLDRVLGFQSARVRCDWLKTR